MIRGRFTRRWGLLLFAMSCLIYTAVYMSTLYTFDVNISLEKPRRNNPPLFPWQLLDTDAEIDTAAKPQNRAIREHPPSLQNITDLGKTETERKPESELNDKKPEEQTDPEDFTAAQAKINRLRKEVVRQKCSNHPELRNGPITDNTYRHIYVNDQHKLLYCFIPKVGCSNWKRVLMKLSGNKKEMSDMASPEVHLSNGMKRLAGFSQIERKQKLQTYTKFVYARHPFVRVLSAFNNKYGDVKQYRKEPYFQGFAKTIMKKFRPNATPRDLKTGENITWTEFVKYLTQPQRPFFDDHWEEMYKLCAPCKVDYDYVGHLETVSDDAKYMLTDLKLDSIIQFPSRNNSHPTNSTAEFEAAFRNLPAANLRKFWEIYAKDFELFDYPKPDFVAN